MFVTNFRATPTSLNLGVVLSVEADIGKYGWDATLSAAWRRAQRQVVPEERALVLALKRKLRTTRTFNKTHVVLNVSVAPLLALLKRGPQHPVCHRKMTQGQSPPSPVERTARFPSSSSPPSSLPPPPHSPQPFAGSAPFARTRSSPTLGASQLGQLARAAWFPPPSLGGVAVFPSPVSWCFLPSPPPGWSCFYPLFCWVVLWFWFLQRRRKPSSTRQTEERECAAPPTGGGGRQTPPNRRRKTSNTTHRRRRKPSSTTQQNRGGTLPTQTRERKAAPPKLGGKQQHHSKGGGNRAAI